MNTAKNFFCLEGIDGSGKTTQLELLAKALENKGYTVVRFREPGGAKISEKIREILLDTSFKGIMSDKAELLLYNAARAQAIDEIIKPALNAGKIVIADRFAWSTYAYQGFARGLGVELVQNLTEITCQSYMPVLTLVLDIDVQKSRSRTFKRDEKPDRLESEKQDFFEKVRQGYLTATREFSEYVVKVNAERDIETIHQEILDLVLKKIL